jgi:DNA repair photolyase
MRFEDHNTCRECFKTTNHCNDTHRCDLAKTKLRDYGGIRFTADGFDCALPITIDSHSACSYDCVYCFSHNLMGHRESVKTNTLGQTSLKMLENIFSGKVDASATRSRSPANYRMGLKYDDRKNGYPCPVQLGGICDPGDNIERQQGWLLKFMDLAIKYEQPVRMSTKGNIFLEKEYLDKIAERPELFWVAFSIISPDDSLLPQIDRGCPLPSERLECMRKLSSVGVHTSLRFRPILPGISDKTPKYDQAYAVLIEEAANAGAKAISYEVGFVPGAMTKDMTASWEEIESITGIPIRRIYKSFGKTQSCTRPSYLWTEGIMHAIRDEARKHKLWIGVSDPVWKQLGECGCCCGIPKDHPVFGNWQRESATNQLLEARDTGKEIHGDDIIPEWAKYCKEEGMICYQAGPDARHMNHRMWADTLREVWNNIGMERSPMNYFQGALHPVGLDEKKDIVYKYVGLERKNLKAPYWSV